MMIVPLAIGWNAHTLFIAMPYTGKAHKIASNSALSERQYSDGFRYSGPKPSMPTRRSRAFNAASACAWGVRFPDRHEPLSLWR